MGENGQYSVPRDSKVPTGQDRRLDFVAGQVWLVDDPALGLSWIAIDWVTCRFVTRVTGLMYSQATVKLKLSLYGFW